MNIILARKQSPIRAIVKKSIETPEREMEKGTVMDIKAETDAGELLNIDAGKLLPAFIRAARCSMETQTGEFFVAGGGEKYDKMRKSIVVSIIGGNLS